MKLTIKKRWNNIIDWLYLSVCDCDGMCNYWNGHLKEMCQNKKKYWKQNILNT